MHIPQIKSKISIRELVRNYWEENRNFRGKVEIDTRKYRNHIIPSNRVLPSQYANVKIHNIGIVRFMKDKYHNS
jgi:hypothetical protein